MSLVVKCADHHRELEKRGLSKDDRQYPGHAEVCLLIGLQSYFNTGTVGEQHTTELLTYADPQVFTPFAEQKLTKANVKFCHVFTQVFPLVKQDEETGWPRWGVTARSVSPNVSTIMVTLHPVSWAALVKVWHLCLFVLLGRFAPADMLTTLRCTNSSTVYYIELERSTQRRSYRGV